MALYNKIGETQKAKDKQSILEATGLTQTDYSILTVLYYGLEEPGEAFSILERGLAHYPHDPELTYLKAVTLTNQEQYEAAETLLESLSSKIPPTTKIQHLLIEIHSLKTRSSHH